MIKPTIHVMIDIETLGLRPGALVWQIGVVHFVPEYYPNKNMFQEEKKWNIDLSSAMEHGCIDASTLEYWLKKGFPSAENKVGMELALTELAMWFLDRKMERSEAQLAVWAKGPAFDLVQLEHQYCERDLWCPCPWSYRDHRDVRTILDLADVDGAEHTYGTQHDALDDAKSQALAVSAAYHRLRLVPRGYGIRHTSSLVPSDDGGGVSNSTSTGKILDTKRQLHIKGMRFPTSELDPPPFYDPEWDNPHEVSRSAYPDSRPNGIGD